MSVTSFSLIPRQEARKRDSFPSCAIMRSPPSFANSAHSQPSKTLICANNIFCSVHTLTLSSSLAVTIIFRSGRISNDTMRFSWSLPVFSYVLRAYRSKFSFSFHTSISPAFVSVKRRETFEVIEIFFFKSLNFKMYYHLSLAIFIFRIIYLLYSKEATLF
jgi:hypothetical protein